MNIKKKKERKRVRRKNTEIEKPSSNSSAIWFRFFFLQVGHICDL